MSNNNHLIYNNFVLKKSFLMINYKFFINYIIDKILLTYNSYKTKIYNYFPLNLFIKINEIKIIQNKINKDFNYIFNELFKLLIENNEYKFVIETYQNYYDKVFNYINDKVIYLLNKFSNTLKNHNTIIKNFFESFVNIYFEIIEFMINNKYILKIMINNNCNIINNENEYIKLLFNNNDYELKINKV